MTSTRRRWHLFGSDYFPTNAGVAISDSRKLDSATKSSACVVNRVA
jgi:hypothetical protein